MRPSPHRDHTRQDTTTLPPEVVDRIIDCLCDDARALSALSLASKQTLKRSRYHLFSALKITANDLRNLGCFLALLDVPWSTFSFATASFTIDNDSYAAIHTYEVNVPRIAENLQNVRALHLSSSRDFMWISYITPPLSSVLFYLQVTDLRLNDVAFQLHSELLKLLSSFHSTLETISLHRLRFTETDPNYPEPTTFQQQFHFTSLDTASLAFFRGAWESFPGKVTVKSFRLDLRCIKVREMELHFPFIAGFLQNIGGRSIEHLFINISRPLPISSFLHLYGQLDLSRCVNLRSVHIAAITLDRLRASESALMMSAMWKLLYSLPSSLDEVALTFNVHHYAKEERTASIEGFQWRDLILRLQKLFCSLKRIVIRIGMYSDSRLALATICAVAMQESGIEDLEKEGLASFELVPWNTIYRSFESPWRDIRECI